MSLIVKPEPFSQEFDRLFTRLFDTSSGSPQRWVPAMDLTEAEDHFVLSRTLTLPDGVNADGVTAEFDRGVLSVRIPKPEERQPRRISIGVGGNGKPAVEGAAEKK